MTKISRIDTLIKVCSSHYFEICTLKYSGYEIGVQNLA